MTHTTTDAAEARARARALEALARTYEEDNLHDTARHVREGGLNGHEQRAVRAVILATAEAASGAGEREFTDAQLKDAVTELLDHRGERSRRVLRGGQELWETWLPAFRAAMRYLPATAEAASGAGEREREIYNVAFKDGGDGDYNPDAALSRLASLPPATDPAISGLSSFPPNWKLRQMHFSAPCADDRKWHVNVYGGREGGDTFVGRGTSADEALRDAARNACTALAAAPTIPATGHAAAEGE